MKTNYKIGETYYYGKEKFKVQEIKCDGNYPIICTSSYCCYAFTLDGRRFTSDKPTLSTSPTEFIAPKEEKEKTLHRIIVNFAEHPIEYIYDKQPKSCSENRIDNAIQLLKSEGYTITKQY